MALNSTIETLREMWHLFGIRGCIISSLSLQIFLFLFAPLRRKTGSTVVYFLIWSAYLVADWIPPFTAGLILNSLSTSTGSSVNPATGPPGIDDDLLALWAASLLCHLGGSFTITAFALEDNELWFRHSIGTLAQFSTAFYVFLRTLPHKKLVVSIVFALLGGISGNALRVYSMHLASLDKYRKDLVTEPDSPDSTDIDTLLEELRQKDLNKLVLRLDVLLVAHHYFKIFKGLVVNIKPQPHNQEQIKKDFCGRISSEDAYQLVSCELGYMYEVFYTNRTTIMRGLGPLCWMISFISSAVVLGQFVGTEKQDFHPVDIRISNALVIGSFVLSSLTPAILFYREKSLAIHSQRKTKFKIHPLEAAISYLYSQFICCWIRYICKSIRLKESEIKIEPDIRHKIDGTPVFLREWSECICSHNLISYCLKERPRVISRPYRPCAARTSKILHIPFQVVGKLGNIFRPVLDMFGLKDILDKAMYVSRDPFDKELWDFIFTNLRIEPLDAVARKLISEARCGWAIQNRIHSATLLHYIKDVEYDEGLLLWHIATELCYNAKDDGDLSGRETSNDRVFSKMLSDYMLYLMVFQPSMMSTVSGTFLRKYEPTHKKMSAFLGAIYPGGAGGKLKEACRRILDSREEFVQPDPENGDWSMAILSRACTLTEELKELPEGERWTVLSHVWLEMLVYAARNCRGDIHARLLCRGGELLTLVWLLMAHFGLMDPIVSSKEKSSGQQEQYA